MPTNSLLAWKLDFWETSSLSTETQKVSRVTVEDQTRFSFRLFSCVLLVFLVGFPSLLQDHETQGPVFHLNYFFLCGLSADHLFFTYALFMTFHMSHATGTCNCSSDKNMYSVSYKKSEGGFSFTLKLKIIEQQYRVVVKGNNL